MALLGIGNALVWAPNSATATRNLPMEQAGAGAGVYNATRQVGAVLGSAAIAVLMDSRLARQQPASPSTPARARGGRCRRRCSTPFSSRWPRRCCSRAVVLARPGGRAASSSGRATPGFSAAAPRRRGRRRTRSSSVSRLSIRSGPHTKAPRSVNGAVVVTGPRTLALGSVSDDVAFALADSVGSGDGALEGIVGPVTLAGSGSGTDVGSGVGFGFGVDVGDDVIGTPGVGGGESVTLGSSAAGADTVGDQQGVCAGGAGAERDALAAAHARGVDHVVPHVDPEPDARSDAGTGARARERHRADDALERTVPRTHGVRQREGHVVRHRSERERARTGDHDRPVHAARLVRAGGRS